MSRWPRLVGAGDAALVLEFEPRIDETINRHAQSVAAAIVARRIAGVRDVVPTFRSVAVYFDPLATNVDALREALNAQAPRDTVDSTSWSEPRSHRIDVRYGGAEGADLVDVAKWAGISQEEVISLHSGRDYRVFMLGFMPGFAYLGAVDDRIAVPRLATPRSRIPAGSVAIAGQQTGVYPSDTPGGWRIVGRTSCRPFNLRRDPPFLFAPGDTVRFVPM